MGQGLWKTDDGDQIVDKIQIEISSYNIVSLSVSHVEKGENGFNKVFVGTKPISVIASIDGGETLHKMIDLNKLKSFTSLSFLSRPWNHNVSLTEPDKSNPECIFVATDG